MNPKDQQLLEEAYEKILLEKCCCEIFGEFVEKRRAGAEKIARAAEAKGGFALPTMYHFKAKEKPYADVLKKCDPEGREEYFLEKVQETMGKLKNIKDLSQKEFQTLTGILEVYGEVYIQSKTEKDYSK